MVLAVLTVIESNKIIYAENNFYRNQSYPAYHTYRRDREYTNPNTKHKAIIIDNASLLSDVEYESLLLSMSKLTIFGDVVFYTDSIMFDIDPLKDANLKLEDATFSSNACIFSINTNPKRLTIYSTGALYGRITNSEANSITDNVSLYFQKKEYYKCATAAFEQMYKAAYSEEAAEPMQLASFAVLSLMAGLLLVLGIAFSSRHNPIRKEFDYDKDLSLPIAFEKDPEAILIEEEYVINNNTTGI